MYSNYAAQAYTRNAQNTASPGERIVMAYDGIIAKLKDARRAIEEKRIADRFNALTKVSNVVNALSTCLDHEKGGEVAGQLERFYNYQFFQIQNINIRNSTELCDQVIASFEEMRNAWSTVHRQANQQQANQQPPQQQAPAVQRAAGGVGIST